jgi:hypothetical protein
MEVITATNLLQKRAVKNRLDEFNSILEIVEISSGISRDHISFEIAEVIGGLLAPADTCGSLCLRINIDEWFFMVDGKAFVDWCRENCVGRFNSDKWIEINSLKALADCDVDYRELV